MNLESLNACVIIPTYNNERTLERVIRGVLEYVPAARLIIVNDGATDSTPEILKQFEDQVTVLVNSPNRFVLDGF